MFTRAKNIYSGKKGQGEGTSLEDFIDPVLERGLYTNNMVLKIKKKKKAQPNNNMTLSRTKSLLNPTDRAG